MRGVLKNLKTGLDQKGITVRVLAGVMGVTERTAWNKLNEETGISFQEAMKVSEELFPEYKMKFLFASDKEESKRGMKDEVD